MSIVPLPSRYYVIRFIRVWSESVSISSHLIDLEIAGYCIWDFVRGVPDPSTPSTPETMPIKLLHTNYIGKRFFQDDGCIGKTIGFVSILHSFPCVEMAHILLRVGIFVRNYIKHPLWEI